uniref:FYVE, RhoGEF and PH domain containing 5b n=1 Tax=Mola mola TaxID=94237 RepID=A0A3Q4C125_MOLML
MVAGTLPADEQFNAYILKSSSRKAVHNVLFGAEVGDVTEGEKEEEEDEIQKMDEDWGLTDSALAEEVDSLETLWISDAGHTADSEEVVDTDLTEDTDAEGCDAGEALADADGLSVGDISASNIEEAAGCFSVKKRQGTIEIKEEDTAECAADDLTESLKDKPVDDTDTQILLPDRQEKDEKSAPECDIACNNLKFSQEKKESGKNQLNIIFDDFTPEHQESVGDTTETQAVEDDPAHEPYYVSSDEIINTEFMPSDNDPPENAFTPGKLPALSNREISEGKYQGSAKHRPFSEDYVEIANNGYSCNNNDANKVRNQKWVKTEGVLNHLDCQPRLRLVSISVPADTETSLTSSFSESELLSPNDSDVSDLEGHIVPFLDDTTDTEQDVSDEHVYEDPGHSSEGESVFLFDKRSADSRSCSLSQRLHNNVPEMGAQFGQRPYMSGFEQPALSSSPMLSSKQKTYTKPLYLSRYPRSLSMEGQDMSRGVYSCMEGSPRVGGAICLSGGSSRCSPLSSSGLSTPTSVVDIPPPFELAYITKRPITKSSPSLFIEGDSSEKNRKKKSSIKHFLMLKFKRKPDSKPVVDVNPLSFKSSAESSYHTPSRLLDLDRHSISHSPQLGSRSVSKPCISPEPPSKFLFHENSKGRGNSVAFLNRSIIRVESFEDRSRAPYTPLPLTKPRSISFPNTDTSDYENVPAISSDYENVQVPQQRPVRQVPFPDFFDRPSRALSSANETDGYVDMSSLPGFKSKTQSHDQETERYVNRTTVVCCLEFTLFTILSQCDKMLSFDFREAVGTAVGEEGEPVLDEERLREILNELPDVYTLHRRILNELENRIRHCPRIADVFLSRKAEFLVFTTYIGHYDRSMSLLEDSCRTSPAFAAIVHQFEQSPSGESVSLKHQLLQVIVRVAQYRMLLTDYLNNLSPDSKEYEDTQAAAAAVSDIADQASDTLKHGENLLRLVNIEYSVRGQRDLLQPGRMNDVLLYTYPQQDGKYRLKNTLPLTGLKVSLSLNCLCPHCFLCPPWDSFIEREDWFYTISRTVTEHVKVTASFCLCLSQARDPLRLSLGEKAPTLVPVSQVMMCMNCTSDFSLTLRRHHCHGCGRVSHAKCSAVLSCFPDLCFFCLRLFSGPCAPLCLHLYISTAGDASALSCQSSPRPHRSSRPLSAVFQNIHPPNIWRHRKGTASFTQVTVSEEGSISGSLQRSKKSKKSWKRLWFLLKDKVLYTYRGEEEKVASESLPLLGFTVRLPDQLEGGEEETNIFQLYHKKTLYYTFKAVDNHTAQRWVNAMEEATVL